MFRPIATDVRGEKRFISTIARRLDTLGAITRGQRQTGGQGLFRASDNLESEYARAALRQLYMLLLLGKVEGCSLGRFEDATGLSLTTRDGAVREELPPITQFLNRVLALTIDLQNLLFEVFDGLLTARVEAAIAAGTYDLGVETVAAESSADRRPAQPSTRTQARGPRRRRSPSPGAIAPMRSRSSTPLAGPTNLARDCWSTRDRVTPPCRSAPRASR